MDITLPGQSRYTLTITGCPVVADVLRFRGREALNAPFCWTIDFTAAQTDIAPEQALLHYASFRFRSGRVVHGVITGLKRLSTSADETCYRVTLESRLALLSHTRGCTVYQNQSVPEVVEQVLRAGGFEGADFEFRLTHDYPARELITQWRETDLEFIQRLLAETGIWFACGMHGVTELDTVMFSDSQAGYQTGVTLPYCEPSGLFDGAEESVWSARIRYSVTPGQVMMRDYNYRTASAPQDVQAAVRESGIVTTGEHYHYAQPYREAGTKDEAESGAFYAQVRHERLLNGAAQIHLFSNAAALMPGQVLETTGSTVRALKNGMVITLATFRGARDSRLHVSVWGIPYSEAYCHRPAERRRPVIHGTLPARVESTARDDMYAWLDAQGRYRVKLDYDRDGSSPGYAYLWLRMAKPYAGETYGWHAPLLDGTEVAVAFDGGDPDRPYIACTLHDSVHPDHVTDENHTRNVLRTPANNKLRLEDQRGLEHVKLATEYGKTQLNLGHLVDAQRKARGTGAELRTDERGALRAGKGLFISADAQTKAQGDVLDMQTALNIITQLQQQLVQLEAAAEQAQALKADVAAQQQMLEQRLKTLNQAVHWSAPEGMALGSGEHSQMAAQRNLMINAGGDISAGVMENATLLAGDAVSLFAQQGELSVKVNQGAVEVQAQNDSIRLKSGKKLTLAAVDEDMLLAGKKRIVLKGGGSYLIIEQGKVEYGTLGGYVRKVARTALTVQNPQQSQLPVMPKPFVLSINPENIRKYYDRKIKFSYPVNYRIETKSETQIISGCGYDTYIRKHASETDFFVFIS
ncbi:type VI secretion system tip protein VgrG [Salmonella enterica subsp. enterica]